MKSQFYTNLSPRKMSTRSLDYADGLFLYLSVSVWSFFFLWITPRHECLIRILLNAACGHKPCKCIKRTRRKAEPQRLWKDAKIRIKSNKLRLYRYTFVASYDTSRVPRTAFSRLRTGSAAIAYLYFTRVRRCMTKIL